MLTGETSGGMVAASSGGWSKPLMEKGAVGLKGESGPVSMVLLLLVVVMLVLAVSSGSRDVEYSGRVYPSKRRASADKVIYGDRDLLILNKLKMNRGCN